ncbi:MAG: hypothetical protein DMD87_29820 [Candidatus Rokuibacteriota bacterium]|nr:MAG: hypothetical protein DMD87_29820 [Candidatus Rokubacteria bacterium]
MEQPTKFELVINMKIAKPLGLTGQVPATLDNRGADAIAAPLVAEAQPAKRVATVVFVGDDFAMGPLAPNFRDAFLQGLRDLGWVEGTNFRLEQRSAKTRELRPATAAEIVKLNPDVIVAAGPAAFAYGPVAPEAALRTQFWSPIRGIPIVFAGVSDPVAAGMVQSLARPGGTMTGISYLGVELNPKRLQLLKEALPELTRVGSWCRPTINCVSAWSARSKGLPFRSV